MGHRLDLGFALASDAWIIANTNSITATLYFLSVHAMDHNDWPWLRRHHWWLQAATRLFHGKVVTALDG